MHVRRTTVLDSCTQTQRFSATALLKGVDQQYLFTALQFATSATPAGLPQ